MTQRGDTLGHLENCKPPCSWEAEPNGSNAQTHGGFLAGSGLFPASFHLRNTMLSQRGNVWGKKKLTNCFKLVEMSSGYGPTLTGPLSGSALGPPLGRCLWKGFREGEPFPTRSSWRPLPWQSSPAWRGQGHGDIWWQTTGVCTHLVLFPPLLPEEQTQEREASLHGGLL